MSISVAGALTKQAAYIVAEQTAPAVVAYKVLTERDYDATFWDVLALGSFALIAAWATTQAARKMPENVRLLSYYPAVLAKKIGPLSDEQACLLSHAAISLVALPILATACWNQSDEPCVKMAVLGGYMGLRRLMSLPDSSEPQKVLQFIYELFFLIHQKESPFFIMATASVVSYAIVKLVTEKVIKLATEKVKDSIIGAP